MTLLDDAKRLTDGGYLRCFCPESGDHAPDCPVPSMPRIVAALEAAERYLMRENQTDWFDTAQALGLVEVVDVEGGRLYRVPVAPGLVMESTSTRALRGDDAEDPA